jgi:hypothetical protein
MPTPTYTPLATVTLGSSASSVTFSSIPATYRDLILVVTASGGGEVDERLRFNGDTGSNYSFVRMFGDGSSAATSSVSGTYIRTLAGNLSGLHNAIIQIMDYSATDKHKTTLGRGNNSATFVVGTAGRWANTAAINSIDYSLSSGSFAAGSTFSLYGVIA